MLHFIYDMDIEKEIIILKQRNAKVEADKAWETSTFRTATIAILIYITVSIVFTILGITKPLWNAIIPSLGYILSTQSLPFIKRWWIKKYSK